MFRIIERRGWYFALSLLLMLPGIIYMIWSLTTQGHLLPLSIDYTGGTLWEMRFNEPQRPTDVREVFVAAGYPDTTAFTVEDDQTIQVKFKNIETNEKEQIQAALVDRFGEFDERSYRSIGPTIGGEVSQAAVIAVLVASVLILGYIAFAFRQVAHPVRFGVCAVIALIHDTLVIISFACIMYLIAGWEIDALFLTAALTVIGYSVNDTIVVFDRIRENYRKYRSEGLSALANRSIVETAQRSLGTQITTLLSLVAILVLGGATLQQFVAVLIVGIISGTYSSIFNATAFLVAWEERSFFPRTSTATPSSNGQAALA
ncbi:MAG TPA: protein translocase subunit SecF [Caldilineaceae bacterium]|nr:protein translocase subunit SecF [Caldilineaceae bacterium]